MKKAVLLGLLAVVLAQFGVWLLCELVSRSVALETTSHRMVEPFFSRAVLDHRNILWLTMAAWVAGTFALSRRLSEDADMSVAFIAAVVLFCVIIIITAIIGCMLPWLPHGGPFK